MEAFTPDAYVEDGAAQYHGREGIAEWNHTDNLGVGMRFDLLSVSGYGDDTYDVALRATSRRFTGTGTMHITLREG
ncbi:nuclear transport factor 2 family protein [Microbacterium sp. LWS13-1.2]|uniref:Nuclear transport factor 2 family protein n=1 Tax=Microbacterium sp. LWS13-1.2 TaxID=3135264 RepID=A0AAU6S8Q0_9MICO